MLYWTLKWIVISFVLIILIHYLYSFLTNMLTVPKVRDLVNKPMARYEELISIHNTKNIVPENVSNEDNMQNELKNFLQDLKKPTNNINNTHTITPANEINNSDIMSINNFDKSKDFASY